MVVTTIIQYPRNLAGKPTFSRSSIFGCRISMVWRFPCRMPSETMPYRTVIRLSRVARNLAKGFPARLLGLFALFSGLLAYLGGPELGGCGMLPEGAASGDGPRRGLASEEQHADDND